MPANEQMAGRAAPVQGIDPDVLENLLLISPGDRAGFRQRVLQTYQQSLRLHGTTLRQLEPPDWNPLGRSAHALKAASASIGALELARLCEEVERMVRQLQGAVAAPALLPMLRSIQRLLTDELDRVDAQVRLMRGCDA